MKNTDQRLTEVGQINEALKEHPAARIAADEHSYHDAIRAFANIVAGRAPSIKGSQIIMLAGPTSSGKTTTAHILRDMLSHRGVGAVTISLDDFYLRPDCMPTPENGKPDFESIHALDLPLMHTCFMELLEKGETFLPRFDFQSAARAAERNHVRLEPGDVAIVEGIHALNPLIVDALPADNLLRLYISVASDLKDDLGNVLLTGRELRLVRRISRDHIYRNSTPANTLDMWPGVVEGEEKHLAPYTGDADYRINTFHSYEPAIFRDHVLELLETVPKCNPLYGQVRRLQAGLAPMRSLSWNLVPDNSVLREFIPGGAYE